MLVRVLRRARLDSAEAVAGHSTDIVENSNYRNLLISSIWFGPVDGGIFNFLPVFIARLGASPSVVGLLTSGPSLAAMLAYVPGGALAERYPDQAKLAARVAVTSRLIYVLIALLPFFLAPSAIPIAAVILWSLLSIPGAVFIPAWASVVQRAVHARRRARLNGTRWSLMSLASAVSIAIFGFWLDNTPFPAGYQVVFFISYVAGLLNMFYFAKVKVPPFVAARSEAGLKLSRSERLWEFLRPLIRHRPFVRFGLASMIYRLALALPVGLYSVYWVNELHATDVWIGLRGTAGYAALVLGYGFWGRVANRMGHRRLLLLCGAGIGFYPVLTALAPSMQWLLPAAALWGFAVAGVELGSFDMLLGVCPEGYQPRFVAAGNMLVSLSLAIGPLLGAALAYAVGTRTALMVIGGLQAIAATAFLLLPNREQEAKLYA